ncbi:MAG: SDR family oxidoreductase [Pseudomonadales bacterium]|nr:SDR family oxidoreductase [Pseudomonadales bacterium]MBO6657233.1 SDR family oxidoreductase [Pseudomonadales bacterium]MBO6702841.1 SDR family oxidoreductase [Pseudomonadales bacterium]MBO7005262.1 SDR family oxidoreductase [Pseudomonadales bacterium]
MRGIAGKTAVVTGGASGMGLSTSMRFLEEGANVVIADYNPETGAAALKHACDEGYRERVRFIQTDVAEETQVAGMIDTAVREFGSLDILFNNAGVGGAIGPLTETTTEDWDYSMDVLAKGVFLGIKHGARQMRRQSEGGAMINTASIAALSGDGGPLVYSAAKAAVVSMTKSAAVELAPDKIRVNAICPGFIVTPLAALGDTAGTQAAFQRAQPWPEHGSGEHIAGAALYLASDDAAFVTGEHLIVDGGLMAAGPELSRRFPKTSGRNSRYSGVTRGSTGESPDLRKLD